MINFTVGPVQMNETVCTIGAEQVPYFRTPEFSEIMLENEKNFLALAGAPEGSRAAFITGSGTASMETCVNNLLDKDDCVLVVNGGGFGKRFVQLCDIHELNHTDIELTYGQALTAEILNEYENKGFTALLVNLDETSTGVLYDLELLGDFCKRNNMFLIVDAISAFLADPIDMAAHGVGAMIIGSQKALAVPPGISAIALAPSALERTNRIDSHCMYLDLKGALDSGTRGQTPFTPAVGTLIQINARLKGIMETGIEAELNHVNELCQDFRARIADFPFTLLAETPTHACTALKVPKHLDAKQIVNTLKDEYGLWVCPNGGDMAHDVFRVGHIGNLTIEDNTVLIDALTDMRNRGLLD